MLRIVLLYVLAILTSCATTAGPFVTSISADGRGNLTVEKCSVQMDPWMGSVSNKDCHQASLRVGP